MKIVLVSIALTLMTCCKQKLQIAPENVKYLIVDTSDTKFFGPYKQLGKAQNHCDVKYFFYNWNVRYGEFDMALDTCHFQTLKSIKKLESKNFIRLQALFDSISIGKFSALTDHKFYILDLRTVPIKLFKVTYKMPMADRGHPDEPDQLITPKEWPVKTKW